MHICRKKKSPMQNGRKTLKATLPPPAWRGARLTFSVVPSRLSSAYRHVDLLFYKSGIVL